MMRLRLSVQRNNLPVSNILWNVPDTNSPQAYTIARLLEDVNQVLPLEAEQWGLEDYIVEVGGFECLHFSPVSQTLKDDDQVSIRSLLTAEVRSRTLCGRYQISEDGRHLLDGIPFGRPYLRQPSRPAVRIPPRKRRRIEDNAEAATVDTEVANSAKMVKFAPFDDDEADDSEEDEEFAPSDNDEGSDASTASGGDTNSDADDSSQSSDSSETSSSSDSDSSSADSEDECAKPPSTHRDRPPGKGSSDTKARNRRRSASCKLRQLKQSGKIHQDATLKDYRQYMEGGSVLATGDVATGLAKPMSAPEGKRKRLEDDVGEDTVADEAAELERRKQLMLAQFGEGSYKAASPKHDHVQMENGTEEAGEAAVMPDSPPESMSSRSQPAATSPTRGANKRLRPDTAAIGRMLARQTRNIDKKSAKSKKLTVEAPPEPNGADHPDFWKSRVKLSAFECWEEDHELSAPPFPFQQHWDPTSRLMRDSMKNKKKGKGKKKPITPSSEEDEEPEPITLNYDDSPETVKRYSDPTAAIESQLMQDVRVTAHSDLPALPEDINSLPALQMADIQVGANIAFKLWVIDPKTVTPEITDYKTAVVEKEGDSGNGAGQFRLRLAERDVPKKEEVKVISEGKKARNAHDDFHMEGGQEEEQEQDASVWEGSFAELVEPKLVMAAD